MSHDYFGNVKVGSKGVSIIVTLRSSTNNTEVIGKLAGSITAQYYRQGGVPVNIPVVDLSTVDQNHTPGGWIETSPSIQNGMYRFDVPDAAYEDGADFVAISIKSSGCFVFNERYNLEIDPNRSVVDYSTTSLQPSALSYVDINYANAYFATRLNTDVWDNASTQDQQKSLIQATRLIDNLNFKGFKAVTDGSQKLQFPRITLNPDTNPVFLYYLQDPVYNDDELNPTQLPTPILPEDIQIATCEIAIALLDGRDPDMDYENLRIVSGGMSGSRVTYDSATQQEHTRAGIPSVAAWRRLLPYLVDPNSLNLRRVN